MLEALNDSVVRAMDACLWWLTAMPPDVALLVLGILSALVVLLIRRLATDQIMLRRCRDDKRRLAQLLTDARRRGDKPAAARLRRVRGAVIVRSLRAEPLPLLIAVVPIAMLAVWCFARMEFRAPQPGQNITLKMTFGPQATGALVHLTPQTGLESPGGYVRVVQPAPLGQGAGGMAAWTIRGRQGSYVLRVRAGERTFEHPLKIGCGTCATPRVAYDGHVVSEIALEPVRFLGVVPGIDSLKMPPWLVAYLLITLPSYVVLRRTLRIC